MSQGFARPGTTRGSEFIDAATIQASATPHTKGSWGQIDASTAKDVTGMWVFTETTIGIAATDTSMLLDIGIGAAASETVLVANVPVGFHAGSTSGAMCTIWYVPIHIVAGTRIAMRIQGVITNDQYNPSVSLNFGGRPASWGGYSIAETIGVDTATSGPTTGNLTDNAWDEAVSSTGNPYRALTIHATLPPGTTSITGAATIVDVGVGGAGSEQVLSSYRIGASNSEIVGQVIGPDFIEADIPAGSRLSIRKNGTDALSAALIGWR